MSMIQIFAQFIPLVVFVIVDAICNNVKISIISAIVFAAGQLLFYFFKTGQIDWFVFVDVGLIAGLGVISIVSKNEMFFKVKPAIIEGITIIFMLTLVSLPKEVLISYFGRMLPKNMVFNPAAVDTLKNMLLWMCGYMLLHIGAVLYTAFYTSRRIWAIVSGPGFYLLFIPMMIGILIKRFRLRKR